MHGPFGSCSFADQPRKEELLVTRNRTDRTAALRPVVRGMHRLAGFRAAVAVGTVGIVAAMALATVAWSASVITHQGYLANDQGAPLPGPVSLAFGIYASASGGSPLWSEVHNGVALTKGSYTVLLGSVTAFPGDLFASDSLWIETSVDGTLMPRRVVGDVPRAIYAERAAVADSVVGWTGPTSGYWQASDANISNTNSGNVGIGTADSPYKLTIQGGNGIMFRDNAKVYANRGRARHREWRDVLLHQERSRGVVHCPWLR
jgi:hypothetical protein